jgi:hypothetical protein
MNTRRGRGNSGNRPSLASTKSGELPDSSIEVRINGSFSCHGILDSAASHTFLPSNIVTDLGMQVAPNDDRTLDAAWVAEGRTIPVLGKVVIDLEFGKLAGNTIMLRNVESLVLE